MIASRKMLSPSQRVLESTAQVVKNSQHVQIAPIEQFYRVANELATTLPRTFTWTSDIHPTDISDSSIQWMFCIDLLNFSFWNVPPYTVQSQTGYNAFCLQFKSTLQTFPILQAKEMASMSEDLFESLFPGIPMPKERAAILKNAGQCLCDHFDGLFSNLLKQSSGSCQTFIELVLQHFPSFRDVSDYCGEKVYFYKRAQILAADLYHLYLHNHQILFHDIDQLTIFADYRLPQILHHFGLLHYSETLLLRLGHTWESGDPMEVEIRFNYSYL
ncbi:hypothetical protein HMI54_009555 [Coelomomyces lativittatus]|nr:hypothetical protein HMI54_009555 [Coelomomyces lativittatus]